MDPGVNKRVAIPAQHEHLTFHYCVLFNQHGKRPEKRGFPRLYVTLTRSTEAVAGWPLRGCIWFGLPRGER
jgi:hypothetical protein